MKFKELIVKLVCFSDLSLAIREELGFFEEEGTFAIPGECFLVHPPKTVEELEEQPHWAEFCRQEDLKTSDNILVQVPMNKKIKKKHGKK